MKFTEIMNHDSLIDDTRTYHYDMKLPIISADLEKDGYAKNIYVCEYMSKDLINAILKINLSKNNRINKFKEMANTIIALKSKNYEFSVEQSKFRKKHFRITNLTLNIPWEIIF